MPKSQSSSILEKIELEINLLETVGKGFDLVKGLVDEVSCPNWIRRLLIDWLKHSIKSIPLNLKET